MKVTKLPFFMVVLLVVSNLSTDVFADNLPAPTFEDIGAAELQYQLETFTSSTEKLKANSELSIAYIEHQKNLMLVIERAYDTQFWMTIGTFIIVTCLVTGGFYLSYLQFKVDSTLKSDDNDNTNKATFKIAKTGIEFNSSVIGLVVLFMSFLFFYLYIKDVYSIKVPPVSTVNSTHSAESR